MQEQKNTEQLYENAYILTKRGDVEASFGAYLELAELGYSDCQAFVGGLYYAGRGVEKDLSKARYWAGEAAACNLDTGLFMLGKISAAEGNYNEAYGWFEQAGVQDYAPAIFKMALYNANGCLGTQDVKKALDLYRQSTDLGHVLARRNLAYGLLRGWGGVSGFFVGCAELYWCFRDIYKLYRQGDEDEIDERMRL
ncbi:MAG: sel1 repeat family protein [Chromatiales bacterium]|nr:sel1 repeat family protein [Gammaproteobacteria bacterium]